MWKRAGSHSFCHPYYSNANLDDIADKVCPHVAGTRNRLKILDILELVVSWFVTAGIVYRSSTVQHCVYCVVNQPCPANLATVVGNGHCRDPKRIRRHRTSH